MYEAKNRIWSTRAEALIDSEQSPVYLGSTMFKRLPPDPGGLVEAPVEKKCDFSVKGAVNKYREKGGMGGGESHSF